MDKMDSDDTEMVMITQKEYQRLKVCDAVLMSALIKYVQTEAFLECVREKVTNDIRKKITKKIESEIRHEKVGGNV